MSFGEALAKDHTGAWKTRNTRYIIGHQAFNPQQNPLHTRNTPATLLATHRLQTSYIGHMADFQDVRSHLVNKRRWRGQGFGPATRREKGASPKGAATDEQRRGRPKDRPLLVLIGLFYQFFLPFHFPQRRCGYLGDGFQLILIRLARRRE